MKRTFWEHILPLTVLACSTGSWIGFPRLAFLAGCAADLSVSVPGDQFFGLVLLLPPLALWLWFRSLDQPDTPRGCMLASAALMLALFSFLAMVNLYWQYHICETPFAAISNGQHIQ